MIVLGIETSCDETSAAVVDGGRKVLSNVVASQDDVHAPYGGVVPELASRRHLEVLVPVVRRALDTAGVGLGDVDGFAVTYGPGLVGSLLIGCSAAKAMAYARRRPLVGVNHLEGHIYASFLEGEPPTYPFLALVVSGGLPVLSSTTVSTARSVSRTSALRISTPSSAPRPVATITAVGVASPSAHGQAMTSTPTALVSA